VAAGIGAWWVSDRTGAGRERPESGPTASPVPDKVAVLSFANLSLDKYNQATSSGVVIAARENFERYGIFAPAIETNAASTGNGILPKLYQEILIYSDKVTEDSLIYVTPTSSTGNRQLYVSDKVGCNPEDDNTPCKPYFKVTIDSASLQDDITFNWWIVN